MKLTYIFDTGTFTDMVNTAAEIEAETGLSPLLMEETDIYYEYNSLDVDLLREKLITEDEYKERNRV